MLSKAGRLSEAVFQAITVATLRSFACSEMISAGVFASYHIVIFVFGLDWLLVVTRRNVTRLGPFDRLVRIGGGAWLGTMIDI